MQITYVARSAWHHGRLGRGFRRRERELALPRIRQRAQQWPSPGQVVLKELGLSDSVEVQAEQPVHALDERTSRKGGHLPSHVRCAIWVGRSGCYLAEDLGQEDDAVAVIALDEARRFELPQRIRDLGGFALDGLCEPEHAHPNCEGQDALQDGE